MKVTVLAFLFLQVRPGCWWWMKGKGRVGYRYQFPAQVKFCQNPVPSSSFALTKCQCEWLKSHSPVQNIGESHFHLPLQKSLNWPLLQAQITYDDTYDQLPKRTRTQLAPRVLWATSEWNHTVIILASALLAYLWPSSPYGQNRKIRGRSGAVFFTQR